MTAPPGRFGFACSFAARFSPRFSSFRFLTALRLLCFASSAFFFAARSVTRSGWRRSRSSGSAGPAAPAVLTEEQAAATAEAAARTSEPVDSLSCVVSCKKLLLMVQVRKSAGRPLLALLMVLLLLVPGPTSAGVSR